MLNQNNVRIRGFGFLKIFLALPILAILACMFCWSGAKYVFFGVGEVVADHLFSEESRYQSVADTAWQSSSVNWQALKTSTVIWQYYLLEHVSGDSIMPTSAERAESEQVLDLDYPYKSLGTCQPLADKVMPLIEGVFPAGIRDRKDFLGKLSPGDRDKREAFVVFRAIHSEIRNGQLTVFRVKFSQFGPKDWWQYDGVEFVNYLTPILPDDYKRPCYANADRIMPKIERTGELAKSGR